MTCDNDDCTAMAVHICCLYTPGSEAAKNHDCEGDMGWFCDTCFRGPIPGLTGSSRLDASVAAGGSRAKRKLEYEYESSSSGLGKQWREKMEAEDKDKETMDSDNTVIIISSSSGGMQG